MYSTQNEIGKRSDLADNQIAWILMQDGNMLLRYRHTEQLDMFIYPQLDTILTFPFSTLGGPSGDYNKFVVFIKRRGSRES